MMSMTISAASTGIAWSGPICETCRARYLGSHSCSPADLTRRINELLGLLGHQATDRTAGCPCRPENGGSGVCGCTLGGPRVTC